LPLRFPRRAPHASPLASIHARRVALQSRHHAARRGRERKRKRKRKRQRKRKRRRLGELRALLQRGGFWSGPSTPAAGRRDRLSDGLVWLRPLAGPAGWHRGAPRPGGVEGGDRVDAGGEDPGEPRPRGVPLRGVHGKFSSGLRRTGDAVRARISLGVHRAVALRAELVPRVPARGSFR